MLADTRCCGPLADARGSGPLADARGSIRRIGTQETPGDEGDVQETSEAVTAPIDVAPPSFYLPSIGYYCNTIWPGAGWALNWTQPGDINTNPCGDNSTASFTRTGMYSNAGDNICS